MLYNQSKFYGVQMPSKFHADDGSKYPSELSVDEIGAVSLRILNPLVRKKRVGRLWRKVNMGG